MPNYFTPEVYIEEFEPEMYVDIERCVYVGTSSSEEENPDPIFEEIDLLTSKTRARRRHNRFRIQPRHVPDQ